AGRLYQHQMPFNHAIRDAPDARTNKLLRILGVPFGVAVIVGGTVGVGILRSPGAVAEHLGSSWLIAIVWILGGLYSLLGANYMAELANDSSSRWRPLCLCA